MERLKELQSQIIKVRIKTDLIDEMKRELVSHANELQEKSTNVEVERLTRVVQQEYTPLKTFTNLQHTVGGKAEWMDLNDTMKE
mmetsp:Transcript_25290/g.39097  ORF Transcript_25290/g.39097 Transcript_25290/m.39097 type:complete len:84 (+) Transcript_25290:360-611(+)